jgi:hypothetical protein
LECFSQLFLFGPSRNCPVKRENSELDWWAIDGVWVNVETTPGPFDV